MWELQYCIKMSVISDEKVTGTAGVTWLLLTFVTEEIENFNQILMKIGK